MRARWRRSAAAVTATLLLLAGCGRGIPAARTVQVYYAGSLVELMQQAIGPAFTRATGYRFAGYAGDSQALANEIRGREVRADVFISAAPAVDAALGSAWVPWYATFATAPLVLGYNPHSRFAAALRSQPWYRVLATPGFRLGRTDPQLDPKGALTVQFVQAAAAYYHQPDLVQQLLGPAENPAQVFPEADLVGRLQAGQLDAGFFYSMEAKQAGIPTIPLPAAIDPSATFTVAVLRAAPDAAAAAAFVHFLLGTRGQALLHAAGLQSVSPRLSGDAAAVPPSLRATLGAHA